MVVIDGNKAEEKTSQQSDSSTDKSNNNNTELDKVNSIRISEAAPANSNNSTPNNKKFVLLSNSQDGKPNTTIMNIQSVCPNSKATVLKTGEKLGNDTKGQTVVVLNKEGAQMKFTVGGKGKPADSSEEKMDEEKTDEKGETEDGQGIEYSKTCLKWPLKKKTDYRLMQVKSIAECSKRAFCNIFDLH